MKEEEKKEKKKIGIPVLIVSTLRNK